MASPQTNLGTLNRALVAISVVDFPFLNVTSGFFGSKLARISFDGDTSDYIPVLTGAVPSGRLYQIVTVLAYINKSQSLAADWEQQRLTNSTIGDVNVVTDSPVMPSYFLKNAILQNVSDLDLTGESNDYPLMIKGTYEINNDLFF